MTYEQVLQFLYAQLPIYQRIGKAAYKRDLSNTLALDDYYGHKHQAYKTIHIAGTNGKGSVSHMLAAVLQKAGYKTGLYTSPHLKDFRERIKINGELVTKKFVIDFVQRSQTIIEKIKPSFFELTVMMAFDYFAEENVDVAVIETGMGGRLDSTNIITPILSIITNIAYDHIAFLGNTLPEIAREKAGIIKEKIPVVIGEKHPDTFPVFNAMSRAKNSEIFFAEDCFQTKYGLENFNGKQVFYVKKNDKDVYPKLELDLLGTYQHHNILTTLCAMEVLVHKPYFNFDSNSIYNGLSSVMKLTGFRGRWQILQYHPLIVLDIAHNENGLVAVLSQVKNTPYEHLHIIIGFVNDKDVDNILGFFPRNATYYFTQANIPRALSVDILAEKAKQFGLNGHIIKNVAEAFLEAKMNAQKNDMVLVTGSAFVVAEVL